MTNKLVVIINSLKVPKIKKILLYEMKFLVPNHRLPPESLTRGLPPPDPRSPCPLSSTEFIEPPPPHRTKFLRTPLLNGDVPRQNGNVTYSVNRPLMVPVYFSIHYEH